MGQIIHRMLGGVWLLYAAMALLLVAGFNKVRMVDNLLNASRPGGDYVFSSAYGFKPLKESELKRALAYNQSLVLTNSSITLAYQNIGFCYFFLHQPAKALEAYAAAVKLNPYIYTFYFDMGFVRMMQGDLTEAAALFEKGGGLLPRTRSQWLKILNISPKYYEYPSLEENSIFLRRLDYDRNMFYIYTSKILVEQKDYRRLLVRAGQGIAQFPEDPQLFYYAAWACVNLGLLKDAAGFLERAVELAPNYAEAYELRAQILTTIGKGPLAQAEQAKAAAARQQGAWQRKREVLDLHYWHDAILFFQIYR